MTDGFEEIGGFVPFDDGVPRQGSPEKYKDRGDVTREEIISAEAALNKLLADNPELRLDDAKIFGTLQETTGLSRDAIGMALVLRTEGRSVADSQ